jgi:hypothetical protein
LGQAAETAGGDHGDLRVLPRGEGDHRQRTVAIVDNDVNSAWTGRFRPTS